MRVVIIAILVSLFLQSCTKSNAEIEKEEIQLYVNNNSDKIKGYDYVVFLPGLGCHGCIQEAEVFMQNYVANQHILFVLTKIESLKILQQKTGVNLKSYKNILLDKNQNFNISTANSIYPCIVKLDNEVVESYGFQSPSNSEAFSELKKKLDAK
jgi:hypothetical protein